MHKWWDRHVAHLCIYDAQTIDTENFETRGSVVFRFYSRLQRDTSVS